MQSRSILFKSSLNEFDKSLMTLSNNLNSILLYNDNNRTSESINDTNDKGNNLNSIKLKYTGQTKCKYVQKKITIVKKSNLLINSTPKSRITLFGSNLYNFENNGSTQIKDIITNKQTHNNNNNNNNNNYNNNNNNHSNNINNIFTITSFKIYNNSNIYNKHNSTSNNIYNNCNIYNINCTTEKNVYNNCNIYNDCNTNDDNIYTNCKFYNQK